ncbi:fimbria/pilus outer membrane usher protein [Pantoea agglomerans]|uniref:fimbria/pilus outer membrane usher protein n=2 Tax=Enterobacter agglomerans TaxID=549 RepID=UPI001654315E|nr:fimbria/pilus outer membrane usher protein [Pantoea agglomerans]
MRVTPNMSHLLRNEPAVTCLLLISLVLHPAHAEDYFDPASIEKRGNQTDGVDLSALERPGGQVPGRYRTEIYLNGNYVADRILNFRAGESGLEPDISRENLVAWGVRPGATPAFSRAGSGMLARPVGDYLPDGQFSYDFAQRRLDISIPQEYVQASAQGTVSPDEWDDGLPAAFLNYAYSGASSRSDYRNGTEQNNYLNLRSGINLGVWRLRNYSSWSDSERSRRWNSINTYVQRDVKVIKAQFVAGDSYTPSDVFDSFAFRGAQLLSDDNMLPESLRGFAPVVRGIAQSNARVTVRQDGNVIYQSYVPPGPFAITDLYPTSSSGDLSVSVREADGTVRQFTQAFSAVPVMQREGRFKYSVTAGKYRVAAAADYARHEPAFIQATGIYGLPHASTLYGGTLVSGDYTAGSLGMGKGLGSLGSISADGTWAQAKLDDFDRRGASFRFQYSKDFTNSGTTFTLAGYRYSTSGYLDFNEANGYYDSIPLSPRTASSDGSEQTLAQRAYTRWRDQHNKRSRAQLNINQALGDYGSLYMSAYQQQYWGISGRENNMSLGYNVSVSAVNYSLNYAWSESPYYSQKDRVISLAIQVPFDRFLPTSWLNVSASQASNGPSVASTGISGTALADNNLSYNVQQGYATKDTGATGSATADYKAAFGEYQAGYNYTRQAQQMNYGAMGGIIVHPYGLTLSQPLGDTLALVRAEKAADVKVENNTGVYTDRRGYAVVPYLTPYRRNAVRLNTGTLDENVDVKTDTRMVVPSQGALVLADFPTTYGQKIMLKLVSDMPVPFGASATIVSGDQTSSGIVDDQHRVYLSGVPQRGTVVVTWQDGRCEAHYDTRTDDPNVHLLTSQCQ